MLHDFYIFYFAPPPPPHVCFPLQARPMEVKATRDFAEPRKLALVANDLVTVIEHGWVREKEGGAKRVKEIL